MPVTAKLSRKFYDQFGEDLVNELVDLFNLIDASYKSDLRELNEINWARFDAKLEQRMAELRSELRVLSSQVNTEMVSKLELHAFRAEIRADLKELKAELIKWMFLFWSGTALAGLLFRAIR